MVWLAFVYASVSLAPIADVRIGEEDDQVRVEVLCTRSCDAEPIDETTFLVTWAKGNFVADVSAKSRFLKSIHVETQQYGAAFHIETTVKPRAIVVNACGKARLCFDFDFSTSSSALKSRTTLATLEAELNGLMARTGQANVETVGVLSERPIAEVSFNNALTQPLIDDNSALQSRSSASKDATLADAEKPVRNEGMCAAAKAALAADAWNLGAYQTVALCKSRAEGEGQGEIYLGRLRTYAKSSQVAFTGSALR